jgi:hypothetical protein
LAERDNMDQRFEREELLFDFDLDEAPFDFDFDLDDDDFDFVEPLLDLVFDPVDFDFDELLFDFDFDPDVFDFVELLFDFDFDPDDFDFEALLFDFDPLDFERDDDFVSPACARRLLTVRAAISSARSSDRPASRSDSLTCSYCRSRFLLHAC